MTTRAATRKAKPKPKGSKQTGKPKKKAVAKAGAKAEPKFAFPSYSLDKLQLVYASVVPREITDEIPDCSEWHVEQLLDLWDEVDMNNVQQTGAFFGENSTPATKEDLQHVIDYATANEREQQSNILARLQFITKALKTYSDNYNVPQILETIASHGSVCGVEKEAAIRTVYALLTDNLSKEADNVALKGVLLMRLTRFREQIVEQLAHKYTNSNNEHYLTGFRNKLASYVGVSLVEDDMGMYWKSHVKAEYMRDFYERYNPTTIFHYLKEHFTSGEKIPFAMVQRWFEQNAPSGWKGNLYSVYEAAFSSTGELCDAALVYILKAVGVLCEWSKKTATFYTAQLEEIDKNYKKLCELDEEMAKEAQLRAAQQPPQQVKQVRPVGGWKFDFGVALKKAKGEEDSEESSDIEIEEPPKKKGNQKVQVKVMPTPKAKPKPKANSKKPAAKTKVPKPKESPRPKPKAQGKQSEKRTRAKKEDPKESESEEEVTQRVTRSMAGGRKRRKKD